jgi:hypothetical protein
MNDPIKIFEYKLQEILNIETIIESIKSLSLVETDPNQNYYLIPCDRQAIKQGFNLDSKLTAIRLEANKIVKAIETMKEANNLASLRSKITEILGTENDPYGCPDQYLIRNENNQVIQGIDFKPEIDALVELFITK